MDLRTVEAAYDQLIELSQTTIILYESDDDKETLLPSTFSFALPLTPDAPQCIHTPQSSLKHILSATLHPFDAAAQPFSKTLTVHTRRFISHTCSIPVSPVTRTLDNPSRVEVEIPRTAFTCVEPVPIYVTVPPPRRELVVDEGLRLRNIKAELIRVVRVADGTEEANEGESAVDADADVDVDVPSDVGDESEEDQDGRGGGNAPLGIGISFPTHEKRAAAASSSSTAPYSNRAPQSRRGASYRTVISRSGALCRFHATLPVRLRFILHQSSPSSSPSDSTHPLPAGDFGSTGSDAECASITQTTLLHSVSFRIRVHATFRNTSQHTERVSTITIPITFLPSPAPLPEVEESVDSAYLKKHDRPPARTNRRDDVDAAPHYEFEEGEAGPSYMASGAPPPFEERDAPPPFFPTHFPSSSSRLPTFLESEQEILIPPSEDNAAAPPRMMPLLKQVIEGEGVLFGFPASSQFSGHTEVDRNEASTPPPSVEMATLDPNVTGLVGLNVDVPEHTIQLTLQQEEQITTGEAPPPPPPPMDDPSDPPPSIHSEYRSREGVAHQATPMTPAVDLPAPQIAPRIPVATRSHVSAPPPYPVPDGVEHEQVARPPPYVDVMPPHEG
jgi:neural Wiskott-Aldrich syndrome protein